MANDFSSNGVVNVNGMWATTLRYETVVGRDTVQEVRLRFMNGRNEVASAQLSIDEARELLGERNHEAMLKVLRQPRKFGQEMQPVIKGELRGKALEFRQVTLPGYEASQSENAIALDSRVLSLENPSSPAKRDTFTTPPDRPTAAAPPAIPEPSIKEANAQRRAGPGPAPLSDADEQARLRWARASAVPEAIASKFLKVDDKYFFPDKKLAFTDRGTKLKAETHNLEVIRSIVGIAEARGWQALSVTGTPEFRQEVWREASVRGINVRGHEPTALEQEALRRLLERRNGPDNEQRGTRDSAAGAAPVDYGESRLIEGARPQILEMQGRSKQLLAQSGDLPPAFARTSVRMDVDSLARIDGAARHEEALALIGRNAAAKPGYSTELQLRAPETALAAAAAAQDTSQPIEPRTAEPRPSRWTGRLTEAGAAAYRFNPTERQSYYVKLQTDAGERVLWGVDLERALVESRTRVQTGDTVTVEHQGSKSVSVKADQRDQAGNLIGEKKIATHRNAWIVEKPAFFDERAERAAAFRNGDRAKHELIVRYPELTNAIATMRIGELFAEKLIERPEDRRRMVDALHETLAEALERGETINAPRLKADTVRKLDRLSGDLDEIAQRAVAEKAASSVRQVGARAKEEPQHVRA